MRWKRAARKVRQAAFYSLPVTPPRRRMWKRTALIGAVLAGASWVFAKKARLHDDGSDGDRAADDTDDSDDSAVE